MWQTTYHVNLQHKMTLKMYIKRYLQALCLKIIGSNAPAPDVHVQLQLQRRGIKHGREAGREASPVSVIPVLLPPLVPQEFLTEHDGAMGK